MSKVDMFGKRDKQAGSLYITWHFKSGKNVTK